MRIKIIGGPWPERVGSRGRIVRAGRDVPVDQYPLLTPGADEVVVLLDVDPLDDPGGEGWTCVIAREHVGAV